MTFKLFKFYRVFSLKIKAFLEYAKNVSDVYKTSNIIITMGEDFNYQDAHVWFKNIDKLIS